MECRDEVVGADRAREIASSKQEHGQRVTFE